MQSGAAATEVAKRFGLRPSSLILTGKRLD
jgi:hypothetical protein